MKQQARVGTSPAHSHPTGRDAHSLKEDLAVMPLSRRALFAALTGLLVIAVAHAGAAEEDLPTFKDKAKRETEEFATQVGAAVIKAARAKPQKIELKKHEYTNPKAGRKDLVLKMSYVGLVTRKKYDADVTVMLSVDP